MRPQTHMARDLFKKVAADAREDANKLLARPEELYSRGDEIRSPFARDYTRILHSMAFRRLKHKTQVFFNVDNDHVCTRLEHVAHVGSVSNTIAKYLGLNDELTQAIAFGHDLGHAPFGHYGESVISSISGKFIGRSFWHERNGLRLVDSVELLEDNFRNLRNLNLTYAVRDGIISHCGEVDENGLRPRGELIDLSLFDKPGAYAPATWEGCVVKIADKIAYLGRDIEDALALDFIDEEGKKELAEMAKSDGAVNTTVIMHGLILDICRNSSPSDGIVLSDEAFRKLRAVKDFNYRRIYKSLRFYNYQRYAEMVINSLFDALFDMYREGDTIAYVQSRAEEYPELCSSFCNHLAKLCDGSVVPRGSLAELSARCKNAKIYGKLTTPVIYAQAVIDFISGMTDKFAVRVYNELLSY